MSDSKPLIVGLGGTGSELGSTEIIVRYALAAAQNHGAETKFFGGSALDMPMYSYGGDRCEKSLEMLAALRAADGVVLASPGYHGTISGLIKNALDYVEDMSKDERPYFEGRAVGLIAVAAGWQATGTTLATLRSITHALRGWPTPMAVTVNSALPIFDGQKALIDETVINQLNILANQVVSFARMKALDELSAASSAAHSA